MGYFPVRYDPRVVIYESKMFIRLATGCQIALAWIIQQIVHWITYGVLTGLGFISALQSFATLKFVYDIGS